MLSSQPRTGHGPTRKRAPRQQTRGKRWRVFVTAAGPRLRTGLDHSARLWVVVRHRRGQTRQLTPANRDPETPGVGPAASRGRQHRLGPRHALGAAAQEQVLTRARRSLPEGPGHPCFDALVLPALGHVRVQVSSSASTGQPARVSRRRPSRARSVPSCGHPLHRPPHLSVSRKPASAWSPKRPKRINRRASHDSPPLFSLRSRCDGACPLPNLADGPMATAAGQVPAERAQGSTPHEHQRPEPRGPASGELCRESGTGSRCIPSHATARQPRRRPATATVTRTRGSQQRLTAASHRTCRHPAWRGIRDGSARQAGAAILPGTPDCTGSVPNPQTNAQSDENSSKRPSASRHVMAHPSPQSSGTTSPARHHKRAKCPNRFHQDSVWYVLLTADPSMSRPRGGARGLKCGQQDPEGDHRRPGARTGPQRGRHLGRSP